LEKERLEEEKERELERKEHLQSRKERKARGEEVSEDEEEIGEKGVVSVSKENFFCVGFGDAEGGYGFNEEGQVHDKPVEGEDGGDDDEVIKLDTKPKKRKRGA
jgi:hypothetical protein